MKETEKAKRDSVMYVISMLSLTCILKTRDTIQLSDKYDRDRLAASSNSASRGKDRDPAPHLTSGSATRGAQGQNGTTTRRTDTRDAGRKKAGEASDDWRRGTVTPSLGPGFD